MTLDSLPLLAFVFTALFLGGALKGIMGIGLPLVGLSLLGSVLEPTLVVALLVIPIIAANLWQAASAGIPWDHLHRFMGLIIPFIACTWVGALMLASIDPALLLALLGVVVVLFSVLNLVNPEVHLPSRHERWAGPTTGVVAGLLNGISTVNGPPLVMYLVGLQLQKEVFVRAYGLIALAGSIPLALSYASVGVLGVREMLWGTLALIPVFLGMWLGQRIRPRINPAMFRRALLIGLILLGVNLIRRGIFSY